MSRRDYSWLPDHHLHVAATLAHVDGLIDKVGALLFDYLKPGPLSFDNVHDDATSSVTITEVAPLPPAVSRFSADALTQLRAAIEHTVFAEVAHEISRDLSDVEAKRIEMPSCARAEDFDSWVSSRLRKSIPPLQLGAPLANRIRDLQPYHRRRPDEHPLRRLAEHTNHSKHRSPSVAATMLGVVIPGRYDPDLVIASGPDRPLRPGDVLVSGPRDRPVPLSIWPKVSIQRPHTGTWHVLMTELTEIEEWVRTVAIPHLIIGRHDASPLPPQLDVTRGYVDLRAALPDAGTVAAAVRSSERIQADVLRVEITEILASHTSTDPGIIQRWLSAMNDREVLSVQSRLAGPAERRDPRGVDREIRLLVSEARAFSEE